MFRRVVSIVLSLGIALTSLGLAAAQSSVGSVTNTLEERLASRRTLFASQVTQERLDRLKERCDDAQLKLGTISTSVSDQRRRRDAAYADLIQQLHNLDNKLTTQHIRHDSYSDALVELDASWQAFEQVSDRYTVALSDSRGLDCALDPSGFIVTLTDARQSQVSILEQYDSFTKQLEATKKELNRLMPLLNSQLRNDTEVAA